ncbi:hypothetical protein KEM52_005295, partial [Ascosphaera acerosa]
MADTTPPTTFSIAGRGLKLDTAEDVAPHIQPLLDSSAQFREIHLGGNTYGVEACELLAAALRKQTALAVVKLDDMFTTRLVTEIPPALSALLTALLDVKTLQTVDLSDNAFGLNTQAPLVEFLRQHVPLRHLLLSNNGLGPKAGVLVADALAELAQRKEEARTLQKEAKTEAEAEAGPDYEIPPLETILCGRNRLETGSMAAWARAVRAHGAGLKTLKLQQDGIRTEGILTLLGEGLRYARGLQVVDLQDNTFTAAGAATLARILPGLPALRELGVSDCLLGAKGWVKVARALATGCCAELQVLRLQFNEITAAGLAELVRAVLALPALRRVEVNGNVFDEEDTSVIVLREIFARE